MKKRMGLVTCSRLPELQESDRILIPLIEARGWSVSPVVWDDPTQDWTDWDLLLIRNPWDYYEKSTQFQDWVERLEVPVRNTKEILQWNLHKFYLQELQAKGVPIIPTLFVKAGADLPELPWEQVVCKPAISAGSYQTIRVSRNDVSLPQTGDWLIQPFVPEIQSDGEYSMIYFGGTFSHGIKKQPQVGDFRVQKQYGGRYAPFEPEAPQWEVAQKALAALPFKPVYARIDGIWMGQEYKLMEIEMIEPDLYFEFDSRFPERLVQALFDSIEN